MNDAKTTAQLCKAKIAIEHELEGPLTMDHACIIHDLCKVLDIEPSTVLGNSLFLIESDAEDIEPPTLDEIIKEHPGLLTWPAHRKAVVL